MGSTTLGGGNRHTVVSVEFRHDLMVVETAPTEGHLYTQGHPYAMLAPNSKVRFSSQLESFGRGMK
ncbi:hypothetical protein GCM10010348_70490 [Streptomyces anthocyanicus]|nr:hypothetical protein GCM10010348_70490 [Streptomyces anthocyanicus]